MFQKPIRPEVRRLSWPPWRGVCRLFEDDEVRATIEECIVEGRAKAALYASGITTMADDELAGPMQELLMAMSIGDAEKLTAKALALSVGILYAFKATRELANEQLMARGEAPRF